jgi:hypothetical protein
MVMSVCL